MRKARAAGTDVPRRAGRCVWRAVVLSGREHLRDQHEQDDLPGGVGVPS